MVSENLQNEIAPLVTEAIKPLVEKINDLSTKVALLRLT